MSNLMMWNLLIAFVLPHAIAVVQQPQWGTKFRVAVTAVFCLVAGALTTYFNGKIENWHDIVGSILTVLVGAVAFYENFWKPGGMPQKIESATSPKTVNNMAG